MAPDSYRPYRDVGGYFVFLADENLAPVSPTTLSEVMHVCDCLGYVRRAVGSKTIETKSPRPTCGAMGVSRSEPVERRRRDTPPG